MNAWFLWVVVGAVLGRGEALVMGSKIETSVLIGIIGAFTGAYTYFLFVGDNALESVLAAWLFSLVALALAYPLRERVRKHHDR